jgi:hypothetical protein
MAAMETNGQVTSGQGDRPPGGLAVRDIAGKRLLDSNGQLIGRIQGISADGANAVVETGSKRIGVPMTRLSLGTGPNTVIASSYSQADALNAQAIGSQAIDAGPPQIGGAPPSPPEPPQIPPPMPATQMPPASPLDGGIPQRPLGAQ